MKKLQFTLISALFAMGVAFAQSADADKVAKEAEKKAAEEARIAAKNVWQKDHKKGAVEDQLMLMNTDKEPNINAGFKSIFDGKTLKGWHIACGNAFIEVDQKEKAIIAKKNVDDDKIFLNTFLVTDKEYKDFIVTFEYKWLEKGNSGIQVLSRMDKANRVAGPQVEIETNDKRRWTGGIYGQRDGAWKYSLSREDHETARQAVQEHMDWNRMTVQVQDGILKSWVNSVPVAHMDLNKDKNLAKYVDGGFLGFQVHHGKTGEISFRNIKIKELNPSKK